VIYFGKDFSRYSGRPPDHASIVFFPGNRKPWHRDVISRHAWVREHYPFEFLQVAA
jgi:lipopolysaccharide biosynthesis glycosyltransferase